MAFARSANDASQLVETLADGMGVSFGANLQLGDVGASFPMGVRLEASGELDSLIFENHVGVGRAAMPAGRVGSAADALDRGCGRWRDQPFAQNQQHMGASNSWRHAE